MHKTSQPHLIRSEMRIGLFGLVLISIGSICCQPIGCKYFKIQIWRTFTFKDIPHKRVVKRGHQGTDV